MGSNDISLAYIYHTIIILKFFSSDIIEDTGSSVSPEIDIGQIEGSFIYGVGLWTSEVIKFHPETGKILTNDTWVS